MKENVRIFILLPCDGWECVESVAAVVGLPSCTGCGSQAVVTPVACSVHSGGSCRVRGAKEGRESRFLGRQVLVEWVRLNSIVGIILNIEID